VDLLNSPRVGRDESVGEIKRVDRQRRKAEESRSRRRGWKTTDRASWAEGRKCESRRRCMIYKKSRE